MVEDESLEGMEQVLFVALELEHDHGCKEHLISFDGQFFQDCFILLRNISRRKGNAYTSVQFHDLRFAIKTRSEVPW